MPGMQDVFHLFKREFARDNFAPSLTGTLLSGMGS